MATNTLGNYTFAIDDQGFFTDPSQWNEGLARELAEMIGLELTDEHMKVLEFALKDQAETGVSPPLRRMQTIGGFPVEELFRLFPGKPAKKIAYLAGLRKPVGCV